VSRLKASNLPADFLKRGRNSGEWFYRDCEFVEVQCETTLGLRSELSRRKLSQRQRYITVSEIFFVITTFILCSGILEEKIAKRDDTVNKGDSHSLRTSADCPLEPLPSHDHPRNLPPFLIRYMSHSARHLSANRDKGGKAAEIWIRFKLRGTLKFVPHLYNGGIINLNEVMMQRGPPMYIMAQNVRTYSHPSFSFSRNFNLPIRFLPSSVPYLHHVSSVISDRVFISSPGDYLSLKRNPDKIT